MHINILKNHQEKEEKIYKNNGRWVLLLLVRVKDNFAILKFNRDNFEIKNIITIHHSLKMMDFRKGEILKP